MKAAEEIAREVTNHWFSRETTSTQIMVELTHLIRTLRGEVMKQSLETVLEFQGHYLNEPTVEQKLVNVAYAGGAFYNFFNCPGSINSLQGHLDEGWAVKWISTWGVAETVQGAVLFERPRGRVRA